MIEVYRRPHRGIRECKYWWFDAWDWLVNTVLKTAGAPRIEVAPGEVAIDTHIHTLFSHCSISQPEQIILKAAEVGLGGIAVMDHNEVRGAIDAMRCAEDLKRRKMLREDFLVIPGVEIHSSAGHIGALFVDRNFPTSLSPEETVRMIHDAGGVAVAVHPYHSSGVGDAVYDAPFDAVELESGSVFCPRIAQRNLRLATDTRLAQTCKLGSSDSHYVGAVGSCYSVIKLTEPTLESARHAILERQSQAFASDSFMGIRRLLGAVDKLK